MRSHPLHGLALATAGALLLTPDALFMRLSGMDGSQMVAWRGLLMGGALLLAWPLVAGPRLGAELRALAAPICAVVILCQAGNSLLFSYGIANAPVAVVLFGVATVPVFSALLARLIAGEPTSPATWIAIAAVLSGIALAVLGGAEGGLALDLAALTGAAAGLGVALALAFGFVVMRHARGIPILPVIGLGALCSGLIGLALAGPAALLEGEVWAIAVSGAVILPVSFFALTAATRHTHASNVSLLMLLETVLGPVWVWLGTGEAPTWPMLAGGAIVVGSLTLYLLHLRRAARRA
ncbi:DMT family transporter [Paralimibaculum aggregatum]|uniref:DMT family transporter n=1 Tax=Paralimibaculum aggregatum TaxID=3036245 RepID=A0ABQ6LLU7_9RHOB|nr:DMT family transporter [Limibaculum sp. NKW23]GMG84182.1 DMT family transporter [Limibaculum sp. NKW23]